MVSTFTLRYINITGSQSEERGNNRNTTIALSIGAILFILAVATNGRFARATNDLLLHVEPYHEYILHRYALIDKAIANKQYALIVPEYRGKYPRSIYFNDIRTDSRDWRNVCYADYFGLERIKRQGSRKR